VSGWRARWITIIWSGSTRRCRSWPTLFRAPATAGRELDGAGGRYDVDLKWVRRLSDAEAAQIEELGGDLPETPAGATLFRAVQDQLGLRLVPKKAPAQIVVIDHVEKKPTEN